MGESLEAQPGQATPAQASPRRTNILIPKFKAGESEWNRLTRMLKDDGLIRKTWAKQAADQANREAQARKVASRYDRRTQTEDWELKSVMHLHDFLRIRQARPDFFRAETLDDNLRYLKRKADIPIFT
jgi:hypothetical protein